ncbi:MAG: hypothetical protein LLG13_16445 [Bacteroidales bacterium]|nr:hypothetical protein [Bacteroidales bacterium]
MIKRSLIIPSLILFCILPVNAQVKKQETGLKREITLYNPYKPSLQEVKKRSFLPDMNDTLKVVPEFHYDVRTRAFMPEYTISQIKAASLLPDPLPKLYKSYVNFGLGNYLSPLAEISITNERSKKGSIGFYGRHYSTNGNLKLQNGDKVFAGYMDNDASLFGRRLFKKNVLESSVDLTQKTRYAYGYDTIFSDYSPSKKDVRLGYYNIGAKSSLYSTTLDSTEFSYDFDVFYNYFHSTKDLFQHNVGITGIMAKSFEGLYAGSGIGYEYYRLSDSIMTSPKYVASISPFISKATDQWSFKLGAQALLEKNMTSSPKFHLYPDLNFSFNVVPSYIKFFMGLSGELEKNEPLRTIYEIPYLVRDSLFTLPNTDHELILSAGLKGNSGIGGNYLVSVSYSLISDMLFYSNLVTPDSILPHNRGNYFLPLADDVELLNVHAEMNGPITNKLSFNAVANFYRYSLSLNDYAWNKPDWDAKLTFKYNLRDKIIAGMDLTAQGKCQMIVNGYHLYSGQSDLPYLVEKPTHFNLNLSAEYRYSKILSFWAKVNNISYNRYYEWAYYPSLRFLCMIGFTYSL